MKLKCSECGLQDAWEELTVSSLIDLPTAEAIPAHSHPSVDHQLVLRCHCGARFDAKVFHRSLAMDKTYQQRMAELETENEHQAETIKEARELLSEVWAYPIPASEIRQRINAWLKTNEGIDHD